MIHLARLARSAALAIPQRSSVMETAIIGHIAKNVTRPRELLMRRAALKPHGNSETSSEVNGSTEA